MHRDGRGTEGNPVRELHPTGNRLEEQNLDHGVRHGRLDAFPGGVEGLHQGWQDVTEKLPVADWRRLPSPASRK